MILNKRFYALFLLLLAGCLSVPVTPGVFASQTVEQKNDSAYIGQQQYYALDPGYMVFHDRESLNAGSVWFSEAARRDLDDVDLERTIVLAVFQGWQPNGGYGVQIEQISVENGALRVDVTFKTPGAAEVGGVTSPYHLVTVPRPAGLRTPVQVQLYVGGEPLAVQPLTPAP